ncbi:MAG: apolipoprotein N-acyltransferase [Fidelibacterota bacterium]
MTILDNIPRWRLATSTGLMIGLAYHPFLNLGFLAWFGFVPLLHIILHGSSRQSAKYGCYAGVTANLVAFHWIGFNNGASWIPVLLSLAGAVLYLAIFWGAVAWLSNLGKSFTTPLVLFPIYWVSMEWLRSLGPLGFPWANLALTQSNHHYLIQIIDIAGPGMLALWLLLMNVGLYLMITTRKKVYIMSVTSLLILSWTYGFLRLASIEEQEPVRELTIAVTQPNVDPNEKWDRANRDFMFTLMDSLHRAAIAREPDLILWPETALPTYIRLNRTTRGKLYRLVNTSGIPLLTGTVDKDWSQSGEARYYNGSVYFYPGREIETYYKLQLVPFAEYIPLSEKFPDLKKLNFGQGNFTHGKEFTVFHVQGIPFSNVICYESSRPELIRQFIRRGAKFITIEANDGYLGNSAGPYQHFALAKLRAIENRIPIVRSANTGISGIIDQTGQEQFRIPIGARALKVGTISLLPVFSMYAKYGALFSYLCTIISTLCIGVSAWQKRKSFS